MKKAECICSVCMHYSDFWRLKSPAGRLFDQINNRDYSRPQPYGPFVTGIHRWPMDSPHKRPILWKDAYHDVILYIYIYNYLCFAVLLLTKDHLHWKVNIYWFRCCCCCCCWWWWWWWRWSLLSLSLLQLWWRWWWSWWSWRWSWWSSSSLSLSLSSSSSSLLFSSSLFSLLLSSLLLFLSLLLSYHYH